MATGLFVPQAAVIPVRGERLCLVTSRSGKRWVVPKGCQEPGTTAGEIALLEAWEEAGLTGVLERKPLGRYSYRKLHNTYHVTVFLMQVLKSADIWPERGRRQRYWFPPEEAMACITDPGLSDLIGEAMGIPASLSVSDYVGAKRIIA
jgi:8-oxo-dGTP pyrophosphatase MutT (NUDIX family)